jgi:hypothetical protein
MSSKKLPYVLGAPASLIGSELSSVYLASALRSARPDAAEGILCTMQPRACRACT